MSPNAIYPVTQNWSEKSHINAHQYATMYQQSIDDPDTFWQDQAHQYLTWFQPWTNTRTGDFSSEHIRWFEQGKLNACFNCVDRHLETQKDKMALIWESNEPTLSKSYTYEDMHQAICRLANGLKTLGIQKGDKVAIYLPMIPEIVFATLACARIGAVHSVIFSGFSPEALKARILDAECRLLITADEGVRGDKFIPLKTNSDEAVHECPCIEHVLVIKRTGNPVPWHCSKDIWYHDLIQQSSTDHTPEWMESNDPLFILYTSGSTGNPKGVVHSTAPYLLYAAITHHLVFDYHRDDIHFCTADIGWITGHSYIIYGPLANGATTVLFEGIPTYPDQARYWHIIDKHKVNIFYTSPTAIRALRHEGDHWVKESSRQTLTLLGSVGEPINPDVWEWYYHVVGEQRCPIVNTWWQTETGGILLTALPGATPLIPGAAGQPFLGIKAKIVDDSDLEITHAHKTGRLVLTQPWPGLMQTIYRDHQRFVDTYLKTVPGCYYTGDNAYLTPEGQFWITGRNDDVINVSGHRIGTEELESAFISHPVVSEAAVVAIPHDIKGEAIFAFVVVNADTVPDHALQNTLIQHIRAQIGPLATPEKVCWAKALPKTRSGKIMRRILRKIACGDTNNLGDLSTLAEADVITQLILDMT